MDYGELSHPPAGRCPPEGRRQAPPPPLWRPLDSGGRVGGVRVLLQHSGAAANRAGGGGDGAQGSAESCVIVPPPHA